MLLRLIRLRAPLVLSLLAVLLLAGVGLHAHAGGTFPEAAVLHATDDGGAPDDQPTPDAPHCGTCDTATAVLPSAVGAEHSAEAIMVDDRTGTTSPSGLPREAPSRPPRGRAAA